MLLSRIDVGEGNLNLRKLLDYGEQVLQFYQHQAIRTFAALNRIQNEVVAHGWDASTNVSLVDGAIE